MIRKSFNRLKKIYKYTPWYLRYRVRHNFTPEQRQGLRNLVEEVENYQVDKLYAVGNEGIVYSGAYAPNPGEEHLLKVALNPSKRRESFTRVIETIQKANLPFICQIPEYGEGQKDSRYWYQVLKKIDGLMISLYQRLPRKKRLETVNPVTICTDLLEQTQALHDLRIIAPNVDAENVFIQPDRSLVRIDLDPYLFVANGKLPRYPYRRLFKLILLVLEDFHSQWREQIIQGRMSCDLQTFDELFRRLRQSSIYGYDDPRENRHRRDHLVDPAQCFKDPKEPLAMLQVLRDSLDMSIY